MSKSLTKVWPLLEQMFAVEDVIMIAIGDLHKLIYYKPGKTLDLGKVGIPIRKGKDGLESIQIGLSQFQKVFQ